MSDKSRIEWTETTWNPVTGCTKVSQGCKNCYALRDWARLSANPQTVYYGREFTDVMCHPERLEQPLRWTKPRQIFVNSMSDLFHEAVPFEFIATVFAVMGVTTRHTYQILTKRPERMREFFRWAHEHYAPGDFAADDRIMDHWPEGVPWKGYDNCGPAYPYENVWLGVSVEDQATADERIPLLLNTPAAVRWLSVEPLLGAVDLNAMSRTMGAAKDEITADDDRYGPPLGGDNGIDWVVVGGESGPHKIGYKTIARPMHPDWVRSLRDQCKAAGVPFFFKQWGNWSPAENGAGAFIRHDGSFGNQGEYWKGDAAPMWHAGKKAAGRTLDGRTWDEYPEVKR